MTCKGFREHAGKAFEQCYLANAAYADFQRDSLSGDVVRKIDWSTELIIHECIIPLLHHHYTPVFYAARIFLLLSASITVST